MPSNHVYGEFPHRMLRGDTPDLGLSETGVYCALMEDSYSPDQNTDETWQDVSAAEIPAGDGYTGGGQELDNKNVSYSGGQTTFDADDVVWDDSTITARYAVLYEDVGDSLICYVDFTETESSEDGEFRIEWDSGGIFDMNV